MAKGEPSVKDNSSLDLRAQASETCSSELRRQQAPRRSTPKPALAFTQDTTPPNCSSVEVDHIGDQEQLHFFQLILRNPDITYMSYNTNC